tara:strand:+ start:1246 stop:1668 length:423 start_codon:yes stop_codon:yes gene_type:complete
MKFYLSLLIYAVPAIFFSCSKSQSLNCSIENYIQSSHYNFSNGMKNQQRNMKTLYTLKDWDQQYLDTKYSCKDIITQFFFCNICCNSKQNEIITYSGRSFEFKNSSSVIDLTTAVIDLLGTMSIGSLENQILSDSINSGN